MSRLHTTLDADRHGFAPDDDRAMTEAGTAGDASALHLLLGVLDKGDPSLDIVTP